MSQTSQRCCHRHQRQQDVGHDVSALCFVAEVVVAAADGGDGVAQVQGLAAVGGRTGAACAGLNWKNERWLWISFCNCDGSWIINQIVCYFLVVFLAKVKFKLGAWEKLGLHRWNQLNYVHMFNCTKFKITLRQRLREWKHEETRK